MKLSMFTLLCVCLAPALASANLCEKSKLSDRYRAEAKLLRGESFAPESPDYRGDDEYNAWILACNRDRDNRGKQLDAAIDLRTGGSFAPNLPTVSVKGQYSFYGDSLAANAFTSLEYRYQLRRERGEWIVTLPIKLDIPGVVYGPKTNGEPTVVLSNRLDVPESLAVGLGLMSRGGDGAKECDRGREKLKPFAQSAPIVDTGYIPPYNPPNDRAACRLPKDRVLSGGTKLLSAYHELWKGAIQTAWSRPGFKVEVSMIGFDPISDSKLKSFERDDQIWNVHTTLDPAVRARYRSGFLSQPHMYTGTHTGVIAHEAGHELGLDDEYRENDKGGKNDWRDCNNPALGGMGSSYMMCTSGDDVSDTGRADYWTAPYAITTPSAAKGIYPWIITRRYAIGNVEQCYADADCKSSEYCDKGVALNVGRNQCLPRKRENDSCSADHQCAAAAICKGKPIGKCITEASVGMGGACVKDLQCKTGSCNTEGRCQCKQDDDCGAGRYCALGPLGIGKNECTAFKANGESCSADDQCRAPATCEGKPLGKCIVAGSVAQGGRCIKDAECTTDSCNSQGICQCKSNAHCGSGRYCALGPLSVGSNVCTAQRADGESCGSDDQCRAPAVCLGKPLGKCAATSSVSLGGSCVRDAECTTGSCDNNGICQCTTDAHCGSGAHCNKGTVGVGRNVCASNTPNLSLGASCMRDEQCISDSCSSKGHCQCKRDSDCGSGRKCKEPITKPNYCE